MHTPEQAKRMIVAVCVLGMAVPTIILGVLLIVGRYKAALFLAGFLVVMAAGAVVQGRRAWRLYLEGPPEPAPEGH